MKNEDEKIVLKLESEFPVVPFWVSLVQLVERGLKKIKEILNFCSYSYPQGLGLSTTIKAWLWAQWDNLEYNHLGSSQAVMNQQMSILGPSYWSPEEEWKP